jgi:surface antigen
MHSIMRNLPKSHPTLFLIVTAAFLLIPVVGLAQFGQVFRSTPTLTDSDIAMVRPLVREGLTGKPVGTVLAWNNPESQNSGTVKLLKTFKSQGRECRRVQYVVKPGRQAAAEAQSYVLTNCRSSDGTWQLDQQARPDSG